MGYYVNPPNESKEQFLKREGIKAPFDSKLNWESVPKDFLPVVLVDNGHFTAAAIAYDAQELAECTSLNDPRPRQIYMVKIEKLVKVSDEDFADFAKSQGWVQ